MDTFIAKDKIPGLVKHLSGKHRVVAPIAKGPAFVFADVTDSSPVVLDYPTTILPPKKYFIPAREELLRFKRSDSSAAAAPVDSVPTVFLGVHNYDMQGILRLDALMKEGNPDKSYLARRENTFFIGVAFTPDENHFSESVGVRHDNLEGFDAFLIPAANGYLLRTLTPAGDALLEGFSGGKAEAVDMPAAVFLKKILPEVSRIPLILEKTYISDIWKQTGEKCLSCGSCNMVCPTCYCFDVEDDVTMNLDDGARTRLWDSCQLTGFAEVAGGENFRHKRENRARHRVYRKFRYLTDKHKDPFCVGCGRCNRSCTAKINIVEMVNEAAAAI